MQVLSKLISVALSLILLTACGGGGGDSSSTSTPVTAHTISLSGTAVDGYISGATACLDIDSSGTCDSGEPTTTTATDGTFSFTDVEVEDNKLIPVIVIGGPGAIDTATGKAFTGSLKNIIDSATITAGTALSVTPLTDLITTSFLQSSTKDLQALDTSKSEVAQAFNLPVADVTADPMKSVVVFAKTQELEQIKTLIETTATKAIGGTFTQEQELALESDITAALVAQMKETSGTVNIASVLAKVETISTITIPANEKTFVAAQVVEVRTSLNALPSTTDIDKLDELQSGLEEEQAAALTKIDEATEGSTITVVAISDTTTLIEQGQPVNRAPTVASNSGFSTPPTTPTF